MRKRGIEVWVIWRTKIWASKSCFEGSAGMRIFMWRGSMGASTNGEGAMKCCIELLKVTLERKFIRRLLENLAVRSRFLCKGRMKMWMWAMFRMPLLALSLKVWWARKVKSFIQEKREFLRIPRFFSSFRRSKMSLLIMTYSIFDEKLLNLSLHSRKIQRIISKIQCFGQEKGTKWA